MEDNKKYCKHCGEIIDKDCVVCPKCGKQVEQLQGGPSPNIIVNNSASAASSASARATSTSGNGISPKSKMVTLLLAIFLGPFGIHRFYVGKIGTGIIWLFSAGLCMFGWIYDIVKILSGTFTDGAGRVICK